MNRSNVKGTVTDNVVEAMRMQADAVLFKVDPNAFLSAIVGNVCLTMFNFFHSQAGMNRDALEENIAALAKAVQSVKKGKRKHDKF